MLKLWVVLFLVGLMLMALGMRAAFAEGPPPLPGEAVRWGMVTDGVRPCAGISIRWDGATQAWAEGEPEVGVVYVVGCVE